jgi:hypothetical protein
MLTKGGAFYKTSDRSIYGTKCVFSQACLPLAAVSIAASPILCLKEWGLSMQLWPPVQRSGPKHLQIRELELRPDD